ncbi:uncharacterized protein PpBr36_11520 [Pyricularia pennisetigena]|uniref:uncharacterized protein n=1 Tax=Pyricularia pennisetigena TaxID=1578925 RepID=UPI001152A1B3|nr:uncharacterized protein PpBr36_11520 [Pyricularia pennisetigena]TLS20243.1 hypothetical protein PpBr36_11520 [Pyricularia pennisetigena]
MSSQISNISKRLPRELQLIVAKQLIQQDYAEKKTVARYATVSREWQTIVEQMTMRELRFSEDDLIMFECIFSVVRRRRYLRYIALEFMFINRVETLDNRNWSAATRDKHLERLILEMNRENMDGEDFTALDTRHINFEMTNAIYWFINYTDCWKKSETSPQGICLELIIETRSYCQELGRRFLELDSEALDDSQETAIQQNYRAFVYQSASGDFNRQAEWDHSWVAELNALAMPERFESLSAEFITGISLSVNNVRHISPYVINKLAKRLPSAEYIDWHYKSRFCSEEQHDRLMDEQITAVEQLPANIKSLCLRQVGHGQFWGPEGSQQVYESDKRGELAAALAALAARQLERLSVTCAIDALDFFKLAGRSTSWPLLKHLAMTTSCFNDEEPASCGPTRAQQIQAIISRAGIAALRMPQLDFFSLANADLDCRVGVFFSFKVYKYEPHEFEPSYAVVELFADDRNEHATNEVLTKLSLTKWDEVAASRCMELTLKVGLGSDAETSWELSLMDGMGNWGRLQEPVVRKRR